MANVSLYALDTSALHKNYASAIENVDEIKELQQASNTEKDPNMWT